MTSLGVAKGTPSRGVDKEATTYAFAHIFGLVIDSYHERKAANGAPSRKLLES